MVGNAEVGKTVFIRNALDQRRPATGYPSSRVLLNGSSYRLQLLEIAREAVAIDKDGKVHWPFTQDPGIRPQIDGVFCLYDVSDRESLDGIQTLLKALDISRTPTCLISCKVDIPVEDQEVPTDFLRTVRSRCPSVVLAECSIESAEKAKLCLLKLLKESLARKAKQPSFTEEASTKADVRAKFPPRTSSRNPSTSSSRSPSQSRHQSMSAKSRENLLADLRPRAAVSDDDSDGEEASSGGEEDPPASLKTPLRVNTRDLSTKVRPGQLQTPVSTTEGSKTRLTTPSQAGPSRIPATPESYFGNPLPRRGSVQTIDSRIYRTFLNMDDESIHEDADQSDDIARKVQDLALEDEEVSEGESFEQLVQRLLATPSTKGDLKFAPSFLCLYRAFATPLRLLMEIINSFVRTESSDMVSLTKAAELLRHLSVLGMWTTYYPGDFADHKVREMATTFIATVEKTKSYAGAARQILNNLQSAVPDEDAEWAYADPDKSTRSRSGTQSQKSATTSARPSQPRHRSSEDASDSDSSEDDHPLRSSRHSGTTSSASSFAKTSQVSSQTSDNLHNLETARQQARRLRITPHIPISKIQWHHFIDCSVDELATEITRIDWAMYSAIRPRDFVRFVIISQSQRTKARQDYIGMMTKHFNHLALFTSGMILLRDKPKHRARMLGRFMDLAWKVRRMNNYHALGAIVAALNSEEIVRLSQTQVLIPQEQQKQFLQLKTLMGHQKSHAVYRMAWENSSAERIPFLPRIQEDLTKAAMANDTFISKNKINWSKFEVMGETILSVQKSQEQPYSFPDRTHKGFEITKLVLETKVLEGNEVSWPIPSKIETNICRTVPIRRRSYMNEANKLNQGPQDRTSETSLG